MMHKMFCCKPPTDPSAQALVTVNAATNDQPAFKAVLFGFIIGWGLGSVAKIFSEEYWANSSNPNDLVKSGKACFYSALTTVITMGLVSFFLKLCGQNSTGGKLLQGLCFGFL